LSTKPLRENLTKIQSFSQIPNILSVDLDDRSASIRQIMTAVTKLTSGQPFGLEKYLSVGVDIQELQVRKSAERINYIDMVRKHFSSMGVRNSQLDTMALVLEEMLMNAIYDAPHDGLGK